jgi:hypothetical protein
MNKIKLLPSEIDRIMDVINTNNIVSQITLDCDNCAGIGQHITMSWEGDYNGIPTTFTVCITNERHW